MATAPSLPQDPRVDVGRLSAVFRHTTNSYKYLFFMALLDWIERHPAGAPGRIGQGALARGMLAVAWYPHTFFRLSFGARDRVGRLLDELNVTLDAAPGPALARALHAELARVVPRRVEATLLRFVVSRLIRPFFDPQDLAGLADAQIDQAIEGLSSRAFDRYRPLYRIEGRWTARASASDEAAIILHPDWEAFLRHNLPIVRGWVLWHWQRYMQSRNPSTPGVGLKLIPPSDRNSALGPQRKFWRRVLRARPDLPCIYSGRALRDMRWDLDHFVPWAFVVHDRPWNLVPVAHTINRSKGDRLPPARFIAPLARTHARALDEERSRSSARGWARLIEPWVADMRLDAADLAGPLPALEEALTRGYEREFSLLLQLARGQGFQEWAGSGAPAPSP